LFELAVEERLYPQPRRIEAGGNAGADCGEGVKGFGAGELNVFQLKVPGGDIVEAREAQNIIRRVVLIPEPRGLFLDDDGQLGPMTAEGGLRKIKGSLGTGFPISRPWSL
jgi:hypothetical protein